MDPKIENREAKIALKKFLISKCRKDSNFKNELLANPKQTIEKEFKIQFPNEINIKALEAGEDDLVIIIPTKQLLEGELSDEELQEVFGGEGGILQHANPGSEAYWSHFWADKFAKIFVKGYRDRASE